ncbi:MAG: redoxin domain-containing protein [Steroidobacteraceae bacterium]
MSSQAWVVIGLLWIVVLVLAVAVLSLARQIGVLHQRVQPVGALAIARGPVVGEQAPKVAVQPLLGAPREVGVPHPRGLDTLLLFISPACPVCKTLLPVVQAIRRDERRAVEVILASDGPVAEHQAFVQRERLQEFPYVLSERLGLAYGAGKLPHAVLIDSKGVLRAAGLVNSREQLDSLFEARELGVASLQEYLERSGKRDVA